MRIKMHTLRKTQVFHVGPEDRAHRGKKPASSHEGEGLSVSVMPETWRVIAQLGQGPTYVLTRADGRAGVFVDAVRLFHDKRMLAQVSEDLVRQGWLKVAKVWVQTYYDDEAESEVTITYATQEDADSESDGDYEEQIGWVATPKLSRRWRTHFSGKLDLALTWDYALLCWLDTNGEVDGVWWNEKLDVANYSAPRGVILPTQVPYWKWQLATKLPREPYFDSTDEW